MLGERSECMDCPMLFQDTDGEDKCSLGFAGPLDDCTRDGIAHKLNEENRELCRQLAEYKEDCERYRRIADDYNREWGRVKTENEQLLELLLGSCKQYHGAENMDGKAL